MRPAFALALAAGFVVTTASGQDQEAVTVKWSLKDGETFYAKSVTNMDMSMGILGMNVDLTMKQSTVQRFKVVSVKSGATTIEMTILEMSMDAAGLPGGVPGLGMVGEKIKGAKLTAVLDEQMQVTKLIGYDKFIDKIVGDDDGLRTQMEAQLSEAMVGQMVSQAFTSVPPMPVKAGDTWERTTKVPAAGVGDATVKEKYTFDGVTNGMAKISVVGDMKFKAGKGGLPGVPPGVKISKFDMKADQYKGTQTFDLKAGRLKEGKLDMVMRASLAMSANGMDLDMTMKIKAKSTTKITSTSPIVD